MSISGKALLVITCMGSRSFGKSFQVEPHIQSIVGGEHAEDEAYQNFAELLTYETLPLPISGARMQEGDVVRVWVQFSFHYHQSWDGEWDVDLEYGGIRVLRRQRWGMRRWQRRAFQLRQKQLARGKTAGRAA